MSETELISAAEKRPGPKEIEAALWRGREVATFQEKFPDLPPSDAFPSFTWAQLERQLRDLAFNEKPAEMVDALISAERKQAAWMPPEMALREMLCLAWVLMDENFDPEPTEGEML